MNISNEPSSIMEKKPDGEMPHFRISKAPLSDEISPLNQVNIGQNPKENTIKSTSYTQTKIVTQVEDRIAQLKLDLMSIGNNLIYCENPEVREMLVDRGLALSALVNELGKIYNVTFNDAKKKKMRKPIEEEVPFNNELLNQEYWTARKKDINILDEERKTYPVEFWFHLKGHSFLDEFRKNGRLIRSNYQAAYKKLFNI